MSIQATEKEPPFNCPKCDFTCIKKSGWNRHIITAKHIGLEKHGKQEQIQFICDCGKTYADRSGLWRHSFKCVHKKENLLEELEGKKETDLIQILINENRELKKLILELVKKESNIKKTNEKSSNKIVNLNFTVDDKHNIIGCL
jgi:hypothetical protein